MVGEEIVRETGVVDGRTQDDAIREFGDQMIVRVGTRIEDVERAMILSTLRKFRSRGMREIAKILGISYPTLRVRMIAYGVWSHSPKAS